MFPVLWYLWPPPSPQSVLLELFITSLCWLWKTVCHFSSCLKRDENLDNFFLPGRGMAWEAMSASDMRSKQDSQQSQGFPAPRLLPLWQTKLPLSLLSAQTQRTIVIIAPFPRITTLLNTALLLYNSPVSSVLLNSIFCYKVGTRLSVYFQKSRGNNSGFPLFSHLSCW